jgi:exonuclease SbcC
VFELDSEVYKVVRELNKAEVYLGENPAPVAITQDEVTAKLTEKLGMSRVEFFNTYFTGQKELGFLGNQKAAERRRFISKVLGYEKVREAQEKVRTDKNSLSNEIIGIKQGLGDYESLETEKAQAQSELKQAESVLAIKKDILDRCVMELGRLHPAWSEIKEQKEEFTKYSSELKFLEEKIANLKENIENLEAEKKSLNGKNNRFKMLEPELEKYKQTEKKLLELEKLHKQEFEKQKVQTMLENTNKDIKNLKIKHDEVLKSIKTKENTGILANELRQKIDCLKTEIQKLWSEWSSKKHEIKAFKKQKEDELGKISNQCSLIEKKGKDGECPTCKRSLKDDFETVTGHFQALIKTISLEIQELIVKEELLNIEPQEIQRYKADLEQKEKEFEGINRLKIVLEQE